MSVSSQFRGGIKAIQRGVISIGSGTTSATATITSVNTAKTELRFLGGTGNDNVGMFDAPRISLTNSTTITATSGVAASTGVAVSWELTEWY